uniref:Carboxylesterase type B domain-containing protein n=1 Tax=Strigamia maritima TaxID=126957 RepID=T1IZ18_STRMM
MHESWESSPERIIMHRFLKAQLRIYIGLPRSITECDKWNVYLERQQIYQTCKMGGYALMLTILLLGRPKCSSSADESIYPPRNFGKNKSAYDVGRNPEKLPVVFYIHGESFEWNSGNPYDGSVLASFGNVVVVTVNFRLGVFGFLSTESVRGNYGLVDLITALHWVEENIEHFGGDPQNVTILGQGHGAALVSLLMISPLAKGAFHRAIVQSGSALSEWAMAKEPQQYAVKLAAALGCPTDKDEEMVICLRDKPFETILAVDLHVPEYLTAFGPTLDGIVLTAAPEQAIKVQNDLFSRYDLLFGVNKYESHLPFSGDDAQFGFEVDKRDRILRTFIANSYSYHLNEIFALLVNEYTDWTKPILHPINIRDATMEVLGDAQVVAPLVKTASYHSSSQGRTFFYNFAYQTKDGDYPQRLGCVHGEELPYVFGAPLVDGLTYFPQNYTKTEKMLSEAVMRYWTNFAKSGDPNQPEKQTSIHGGKNKNRFVKLNWPPYENAHQKYLSIGMRPKIRHHYRAHKLSVWTKLIPEIHHPGDESVGVKHHLFNRHDDPTTFEGNVRHAVPYTHEPPTQSPPYTSINSTYPRPNLTDLIYFGLRPPPPPTPPNAGPVESGRAETIPQAKNQTEPQRVEAIGPGGYSTALSVTIAVGCSLLILNVLIFAGVYYQRDKNRLEAKLQKRSAEQTRKSPHHHEPNVGAMAATHTNTTGSPHQSKGVHLPQQLPPGQLRVPPPSPIAPTEAGKMNTLGKSPHKTAGHVADDALPESQPLLAVQNPINRMQLPPHAPTGGRNPKTNEIHVMGLPGEEEEYKYNTNVK